jgi:hypothetical protein
MSLLRTKRLRSRIVNERRPLSVPTRVLIGNLGSSAQFKVDPIALMKERRISTGLSTLMCMFRWAYQFATLSTNLENQRLA